MFINILQKMPKLGYKNWILLALDMVSDLHFYVRPTPLFPANCYKVKLNIVLLY